MKHHAETAYLLLLGLIICLAGFLAGLLPKLPAGLPYWMTLLTLSIVYPLTLVPAFRENRVDYEFRLLHWFPTGMFLLWGLLQFAAPRSHIGNILMLGFLFLWSLPLVALGLSFIILFAIHVMRQSSLRVTVLSILLVLYGIGGVAAEAKRWDRKLQATIFPKDPATIAVSLKAAANKLTALVYRPADSSSVPSASSPSSGRSSRDIKLMMTASDSAAPSMLSSSRPTRLPKSGPESAGVLFVLVVAGYCTMLQRRSQERSGKMKDER